MLIKASYIMAEPSNSAFFTTKPNYFYSVISVALVLFTLGFFGLVVVNAQLLVKTLKEQVNITVELLPSAQESDTRAIEQKLNSASYVRVGSVEYISKEAAASFLREDFGEDFLKLDLPNPLYDVFTFNVKASYMYPDSLEQIKASLKRDTIIAGVYYQESLVNDIAENIRSISWIAIGVLLLFTFVAVVLIHNTVRLALYANRFIVKNMQLVGASWEFISRPYIRRGATHGLFSGLIASGVLFMLYLWIQSDVPGLRGMVSWTTFGLLIAFLLLLGAIINSLSTFYVVRKYLKMRVDDLY
jgi:cell division transport system permease protein